MESAKEMVMDLTREYFDLEEGIEQFIWFRNGLGNEIRLIEVNRNTLSEGEVLPFYLRPTEERPWPALLGVITPEEWGKVKRGIIALPEGWSMENTEIISRDKFAISQ